VLLAQKAQSAPLQWEQIRPIGVSPAARHGHAAVTLDSQQGMLYVFGGSGLSGIPNRTMDVWMLDSSAKGWESVVFEGTTMTKSAGGFVYADDDCKAVTINAQMPVNRAGHTAVSTGSEALICGGFTKKQTTSTVWAGNGNDIECWWFSPVPYPRFDPVKLKSGSLVPATRWGHAIAQDPLLGHVLLFGGMSRGNTALNDCWFLQLTNTLDPTAHYEWVSCTPTTATALKPMQRYGAGAVFHESSQSFILYGGFAWSGMSFNSMSDMWVLKDFVDVSKVEWKQINAVSDKPMARGFHAIWLSGYTIFIHGGQGPGGVGISSVRSDTWSYDIFTKVWKQFGSSDASPVASSMAVGVLSSTVAVSFGGLGPSNTPIVDCVFFDAKSGWTSIDPAGTRPPRSAGNSAIYDPDSFQMLISFGVGQGPTLLDDQWILDLTTLIWVCSVGSSRECQADQKLRGVTSLNRARPSKRAFAASRRVGVYKFVFGGIVYQPKMCTAGLTKQLLVGDDEMWAMNMASQTWSRVDDRLASSTPSARPAARAFSQLVNLPSIDVYLNPLMLLGGANMSCVLDDPPCEVPQPMNDVWVSDGTTKPTSATDSMCSLDGLDDVVAITLPAWCKQVTAMGTIWLDMWLQPQSMGNIKTILFDAYNGRTPVLRWYLQGDEGDVYAILALSPGKAQVQVKRWGPLPPNSVGFWHHFCFTVRFGRFYSSSSMDPRVSIAQAFLFVDGNAIKESSANFLTIDIKNTLSLSSGLSKVYVGGPHPSVSAPGYSLLKGSIDNVRIWWPSCPHSGDPSKCNPFAFLYPKLKNGNRRPSSGIQDSDVQMHDVASPVLDAMFNNIVENGESKGLLVAVSFNGPIADGVVTSDVDETQTYHLCQKNENSEACAGCEDKCLFQQCAEFDLDCVGSAVSDQDNVKHYAEVGTCKCRDVVTCPTYAQDCKCPTGLFRICEACNVKMHRTTGEICKRDDDDADCLDVAAFSCPPLLCDQWGCSCFDPSTLSGTYGQSFSVDKNTGTATCQVATGTDWCAMGDIVEDESECCEESLEGSTCRSWASLECEETDDGKVCTEKCTDIVEKREKYPFLCGITSCCLSGGPAKEFDDGTVPPGSSTEVDGLVTCTADVNDGKISLSCSLAQDAPDGTSLEGTFAKTLQSGPPQNRRRSISAAKVSPITRASNPFKIAPGGALPVDLDDEQVRTLSQILSGLTVKAPGDPVLIPSKQAAAQRVAPARRRLLNGHTDDYDGGYVVLAMEVRFSCGSPQECEAKCGSPQECEANFGGYFFKCDGNGDPDVTQCRQYSDDVSSYEFQDAVTAAINTQFPDYTLTLSKMTYGGQKHETNEHVFTVLFKVTGSLNGATGLFDGPALSDFTDTITGKIEADAGCCGQTTTEETERLDPEGNPIMQGGKPVMEHTTSWDSCVTGPDCDGDDALGKMSVSSLAQTLAVTPFVCGDGTVAATSLIDHDTDVLEQCDEGYEYNHKFSSCTDKECKCNEGRGFESEADTCVCKRRPPDDSPMPSAFKVTESTANADADNNITTTITFNDDIELGADLMVVEIVGLTGSQTSSSSALPITCYSPWIDCQEKLGVLATKTAMDDGGGKKNAAFNWGKGAWDQDTGTLKFTVAADTIQNANGNEGPLQLRLGITLKNRASAQSGVIPFLRICGTSTWPDQSEDGYMGLTAAGYSGLPLLASNIQSFDADSNCTLGCSLKKWNSITGTSHVVATVSFDTPPTGNMKVSTPEAIVGRGVSLKMNANLPQPSSTVPCSSNTNIDTHPTCSTFAGAQKSLLTVKLGAGEELRGGATLNIALDTAVVRTRGGCFTTESKTLTICLPGYVGLYRFNDNTAAWEIDQAPTSSSSKAAVRGMAVQRQDVTSFSTWAALATSPCCDYEGSGTACGDKICFEKERFTTYGSTSATVALGDGTLSKMPAVGFTDRPAFTSREDIKAAVSFGPDSKTMQLRRGWKKSCPDPTSVSCGSNVPGPSWFPPRFGHVVEAVGSGTLIIYGGMGCSTYETVKVNNKDESRCKQLIVLDDLWEFNVALALVGQPSFSQLETSPRLKGMVGMTAASLPNADNRVLMFGGSKVLHAETLMSQRIPPPIDATFQVRNLEFRARKATRTDLPLTETSFNVKVQNSTHVILFGGFIGNALSSAVFVYEMTAASPALGFSPVVVLSLQAPEARSFPGLVKPDETSLLMYGGFSEGAGRSDVWLLNVVSSSWTQISKQDATDPDQPYPTAFDAFSSFYVDSSLVVVTSGGLRGGYKSGTSFTMGPSRRTVDQDFSLSNDARFRFWDASNPTAPWNRMLSKYPVECCNPNGDELLSSPYYDMCVEADYWGPEGCKPEARAMHTLTYGTFVAGKPSLLMFGGVQGVGTALQDLWYIDLEDMLVGFTYYLQLDGLTDISTWPEDRTEMFADLKTILVQMVKEAQPVLRRWKVGDVSWASLDIYEIGYDSVKNQFYFRIRIHDKNIYHYIVFSAEAGAAPVFWENARDSNATALASGVFDSTTLTCPTSPVPAHPICLEKNSYFDVAFSHTQYNDLATCDISASGAKCMRGMCMGSTADTRGLGTTDESGDTQYCYRLGTGMSACTVTTTTVDETTGVKTDTTDPTGDYTCSLPGVRHGHAALSFTVLGKMLAYAIFGGEASDLVPATTSATSILSNEVHTLHFTPTTVTWIKLWTSCDETGYGTEPVCPPKRRDAALSIMGNNGGANGRLVVFGGMGGASEDPSSSLYYKHGMKSYLDKITGITNVKVYDDLWYLDLADLDEACVAQALCTKSLRWHRVEVTGSRPGSGFGAGLLLDPTENLYIIGGTDSSFEERKELYVFQLRDPFYKHCSATGSALTSAMAGVRSVFYLQCMDSFEDPADGASFKVDISGPVGMIPGIVSLGDGKYSCSYTPVKVGSYSLSIYVGRGGSKFQDLITGLDSEPSNTVLDGEFQKLCTYEDAGVECKTAQNPYTLTVVPGPTSPDVTLALGSYMTLSTAGVAADFVITAKDAFGNRRPGGDTISALMGLWACKDIDTSDQQGVNECLRVGAPQFPDRSPETGTVSDNSDGSYSTSYLITCAGKYALSIEFSGTLGAGSPYILTVVTDVADKSLTYVYGKLKGIAAGVASELYVQTRDRYGNPVRANPDLFPIGEVNGGTESIKFQVCKNVGSDTTAGCGGGEEYTAVGVTISYSVGPDKKSTDSVTGDPYYGLYQIVFFPFDAEPVQPRILHGDKTEEGEDAGDSVVVKCYFDTTGVEPVRSKMDPGADLANACVEEVTLAEANARRSGLRHAPPLPLIHISAPSDSTEATDARMPLQAQAHTSPFSLPPSSSHSWRRELIKQEDLIVDIQSTFDPPNTDLMRSWLWMGPFICAGIAGFFSCCALGAESLSAYRKKQFRSEPAEKAPQAPQDAEAAQDAEKPPHHVHSSLVATLNYGRVDESADLGVIVELFQRGLLTREQYANAVKLAQKQDPRVIGALSLHDRNCLRTALVLTKLTPSGGGAVGGGASDQGNSAANGDEGNDPLPAGKGDGAADRTTPVSARMPSPARSQSSRSKSELRC